MDQSVTRKRLVIAAASRHGSTREIADRLAATLERLLSARWRVVRVGLTDHRDVEAADAVVLGSAIYYGRWLRPASSALRHLRKNPPPALWLFSTGPVSDDEAENAELAMDDALADLAEDGEHMVFGGRLDESELGPVERLVVKTVHVPPGDHRDWSAIDRWAAHIAAELEP